MKLYTVTYTNVFVKNSTLSGLTYTDNVRDQTEDDVAYLVDYFSQHEVTPVNAYCSSNYTIANVTVTEQH